MSLVMHLRLGAESAPRLFDNLYPFKRKRSIKEDAEEDAEEEHDEGAGYARRREQQRQQHQHQQRQAKKAVRNRREHFVQHQHLLLRLVRAAPAAALLRHDSNKRARRRRSGADEPGPASLWEAAARLLSTPFALESGDVRPLGDVSVRVGLELVRNTQPARGAHQLMLHLGHAYIIHTGALALEKAFSLAGQSRWRDAYDALQNFLIVPGFRENPLFGAYCGMLQFITYSGSLAVQESMEPSLGREGEGQDESEAHKHLMQTRRHLETAFSIHEGPVLLHFLAGVVLLTEDADESLKLVRSYCQRHPRDPHGYRILLDLSSKHYQHDRAARAESTDALLVLDPASMPALAATLDLYEQGHMSLAETIKRVALLIEHIPGDESLWALLWQSFKELAQHNLTQVQETDLVAFWAQRRSWWAAHFFATSLVPLAADPEGELCDHLPPADAERRVSRTELYYRALCSRVIYGDTEELTFPHAVRRFIFPAGTPEPEAGRDEDEWGLLFVPPPYVLRGTAPSSTPAEGDLVGNDSVDRSDTCDAYVDLDEEDTDVGRGVPQHQDNQPALDLPQERPQPAWRRLRNHERDTERRQEAALALLARERDREDADERETLRKTACRCCGMRPRRGHHCLHMWRKCRHCLGEDDKYDELELLSDSEDEC